MKLISTFIADNFFYVFLGIIALTLFQRKYGKAVHKKCMAVLYIAILAFALHISAVLIVQFERSDALLLVWAAAAAVLFYYKGDKVFPFKYKCVSCSSPMSFNEIFFDDSNMCESCRNKLKKVEEPDENDETEE